MHRVIPRRRPRPLNCRIKPTVRHHDKQGRKSVKAMNDDFLKKIIVTAVALLGLASWMVLDHSERKDECLNNCATDFSANRR
jgi:hypothetical protein